MNIALQRILVALDFSDLTEHILKHAAELARVFGSELLLCHVVDRAAFLSQLPPGGEGYLPPNLPQLQEEYAREQIAEWQKKLPLPQSRLVFGQGSPYREIVRIARDENVDLLILGTHGHGAIVQALLGSVAERVVRHAPCPVLTVRTGAHDFVSP